MKEPESREIELQEGDHAGKGREFDPSSRKEPTSYRGRIAPSPTGYLHPGHGRTFWHAMERAREKGGVLIYRNEDLDYTRSRPHFAAAAMEDLRRLGILWDEGPDREGGRGPYTQSERMEHYLSFWKRLQATGLIYPCHQTRRDIEEALSAPHSEEREPPFPLHLRPPSGTGSEAESPGMSNWRFRVPEGEKITFVDGRRGEVSFEAGFHFGDFLVWRRDGVPSYEFAVVVDDALMGITEVVRGEDLLLSTARQILLYRALGLPFPDFYHLPLLLDETGKRMAKRKGSMTLRALFERGLSGEEIRESYFVGPGEDREKSFD